eukprot:gene9145-6427_t
MLKRFESVCMGRCFWLLLFFRHDVMLVANDRLLGMLRYACVKNLVGPCTMNYYQISLFLFPLFRVSLSLLYYYYYYLFILPAVGLVCACPWCFPSAFNIFLTQFQRRTPKNQVTRRAVKKYEPKVIENPKKILFLKGANANEVVTDAMNDLTSITKPYNAKLKKRNAFTPFEGRQHIEFLGFKNDCSLFCFGSNNKKRPNNITIGRLFDFHILDMIEMGIIAADNLDMSRAHGTDAGALCGKPFFVFDGSEFTTDPTFVRLKNLLIDYFRGNNDTEISLDGCDRVLYFSLRSNNGEDACVAPSTDCYGNKPPAEAGNTILCMRHYAVQKPSVAGGLSKSLKNVELFDIGPNFDFQLRRASFATPQEFRMACRLPRSVLATLRSMHENVQTDGMNNVRGQLHVGSQNLGELNLRRFKAKRGRGTDASEATEMEEKPRKRQRDENAVSTAADVDI